MQHLECVECRAIFNEIKEAWRAAALEMGQLGLTGDSDLAQAWRQARKLRTEEQVALAEEVFPTVQLKSSARYGQALNRKSAHEVRSGHKLILR